MRWLVEVSRVGDGSSTERYCIDARRWQSALQEVRRLRGDEGPLPKLTIELLDAGYRAVDPELKIRYVVTEAPADMPVTVGAQIRHSTQPPPAAAASVAPVVKGPAAPVGVGANTSTGAPAATLARSPAPSIPAAAHLSEPPSGGLAAQVIRQREEAPTAESPIHYREIALAVRPGAKKEAVEELMRSRLEQMRSSSNASDAQEYVQIAVFDHMFVKKPVRPPVATLAWKNWRGDPVLAFPGFPQKRPEPSAPMGTPSTRPPSWTSPSEAPKAPSVSPAPVVSIGTSAQSAASAIPRPGAGAASVEPAARPSVIPAPVVAVGARLQPQPSASLAENARPLVQGDAEIPVPLVARRADPHADELDISVDVAVPVEPAAPASIEIEVAPSSSPLGDTEVATAGEPLVEADVTAAGPDIDIEIAPPSAPLIDVAVTSIPASELPVSSAPPAPAAAAPSVGVPPVKTPSVAPQAVRPSPPPPAPQSSAPPPRPSPLPGAPRRRAPGEDLIADLFERMHELSFMADMVSGAEFVLHVLSDVIPCEGIIVHVFDLGRREFVVVRAQGPNARNTLLHRTPGDEPLVRSIMSRHGATILDGAPASVPPASSSLERLGIKPTAVLCGAARLGGRYLGLIELANPQGGQPFHAGEANALDYVCEQFAEFVASRPIVLDADVVIGP